jgi:hypothetical protein
LATAKTKITGEHDAGRALEQRHDRGRDEVDCPAMCCTCQVCSMVAEASPADLSRAERKEELAGDGDLDCDR